MAASGTTVWTGASSTSWSDSGNWTSGVPGFSTDVYISTGATRQPSISSTASCGSIIITGTSGTSLTLTLDAALTVANDVIVSDGITFTLGGTGVASISLLSVGSSTGSASFTLNANCTLTCDGVSLLANSLFINYGNSTFYGTITINDSGSLKNSGTINAGSSGTACTINLSGTNASVINNATFQLGATSSITPGGASASITNNSPGVFTLKSDATGTAAIGKLGSGASCNGTFNVERFIHGGSDILYRNYRFFSSPVYTSTQTVGGITFNSYDLKYLNTSNTAYPITTGTGGTSSGFDKSGNPTIYVYREDRAVDNSVFSGGNYIGVSNITGTALNYDSHNNTTTSGYLPAGNGFAFFYRGTKALLTGRTTLPITAANYPDDATVTQTGSLNQGNVPVNLWYNTSTPNSVQNTLSFTASNTTLSQGVNLVGNPYANAIDWNSYYSNTGIISSHVLPTIYIFNPVTKQYDLYQNIGPGTGYGVPSGTSNIITSGQAFFVIADDPTAQLTFTENAKSTTSPNQGTLLMGMPQDAYNARQILRLKLFIDSLNYDDIVIGFNANSSTAYNNMEDSQYLAGMNAAEGLASFSSDKAPVALSINFLPLPKKQPETIRLKVTATNSGLLTLKKMQLDELPKIYELWLMDRYKKDSLDLRNNSDYAFEINKADTASYGNNRFQIIVRQNAALGVHLLDFAANKSSDGVPLSWKTENEENYTNFTVERSTDNGLTFDVLGGFASNGQGTYTFTDKNPVKTVDIYRLKLEDLNGTISYSNSISIVYDASKALAANSKINVYPNPATGTINLAINQPGTANTLLAGVQNLNHLASIKTPEMKAYGIKIISVTGSVVKNAVSSSPNWQDNISGLLPGTYFIQVINNSDNSLVGKSSFVKL